MREARIVSVAALPAFTALPGLLGTVRAQYHLRQVFVFLNMFPLNRPEVMISKAAQRFDESGNLTDAATRDFIRQLLQELVSWTLQLQAGKSVAASESSDAARSRCESGVNRLP